MKKALKDERLPSGYMARDKKDLDKLTCYSCDKFLCWVYEYDLNESYFFCEDCYKKIPDYFFPY